MKLLVTGASGFIGHNVLLRAPRDWEIVAVYNSTPGLEAFVKTHRLTNVRPMRCDLLNEADVQRLNREIGAKPDALRTLDVGLFDAYKRIQRIDVQVAGPKGQAKVTLKRPARKVQLVR